MNPKETPELTVQTLMTLRQESDALRIITERLRVKEMGPADHIRTKHEVKAFVESGNASVAESIIKRSAMRRAEHNTATIKATLRKGQNLTQ